jgi:hypothetical protein
MNSRRKARKEESVSSDASPVEWVGGIVITPFYGTQPAPYLPELMMWIELPEGLVIGHEVIHPHGPPASFGALLNRTMSSPMVGPPRRPTRIRVSSRQLAAEVRPTALGIEVVVGPTPELDEPLQVMTELAGWAGRIKTSSKRQTTS